MLHQKCLELQSIDEQKLKIKLCVRLIKQLFSEIFKRKGVQSGMSMN